MSEAVKLRGMPVTVKGQVTLPKPLRDHLGVTAGSRVTFLLEPDGRVTVRREDDGTVIARESRISHAVRIGRQGRNALSTEDIMRMTRGEDWGTGTG